LNKIKRFIVSAILFALLMPTAAFCAADDEVILGGIPFGLTMYTSGVIVVNVDESDDSPAREAGIRENDVITRANGEEITTNEQLKAIVEESRGEDIALSLYRGESPISLSITPRLGDDGAYTIGMWIRDSTAGLGTVTYFDESSHSFGALGHGVNDRDTGILLPLRSGRVVGAEITSVSKAQPGVAGGLNGAMTGESIGEITVNTAYGVFGRYENLPAHRHIKVADDDEIRLGEATITCTLDDTGVHSYDVMIERLSLDDNSGRNMVVRVTDPELLDRTGGIVQGMSGSPIVQDGKLVGALTHVFVNSPETGCGISIGNMRSCYESCGSITY
jgi:stage IV sporulation protein B